MIEPLRFTAEIIRIATKIDHAYRLTLDLPESEYKAAMNLIECYQRGAVLEIMAIPVLPSLTNGETEAKQNTARNPIGMVGG